MRTVHADEIVRTRIDADTKRRSEKMLADMGLTMSEAIRLFLVQTVRQRIPPEYSARIPPDLCFRAPVPLKTWMKPSSGGNPGLPFRV